MKGDLIEKFEKMHKFLEIALLVLGQECNLIFCTTYKVKPHICGFKLN